MHFSLFTTTLFTCLAAAQGMGSGGLPMGKGMVIPPRGEPNGPLSCVWGQGVAVFPCDVIEGGKDEPTENAECWSNQEQQKVHCR